MNKEMRLLMAQVRELTECLIDIQSEDNLNTLYNE